MPDASDQIQKAWQKALRILSARMQSEALLAAKLAKGGFTKDITESIVQKAKDYGLIDDKTYAESLARREKKKGRGPLKILAMLRSHGIASQTAKEMLHSIGFAEGEAQIRQAQVTLKKKLCRSRNQMDWQKSFRYLLNQGFEPEAVRKALKRPIKGEEIE